MISKKMESKSVFKSCSKETVRDSASYRVEIVIATFPSYHIFSDLQPNQFIKAPHFTPEEQLFTSSLIKLPFEGVFSIKETNMDSICSTRKLYQNNRAEGKFLNCGDSDTLV